jgi:phosphoserine phosphatase
MVSTPATAALVLTAAPGSGALRENALRDVADALGASMGASSWLSPGDAWQARLDLSAPDEKARIVEATAQALATLPVDVNFVWGDERARRKRLLCADMESTIIEQELIDEIAGLVGCQAEISAITAAAMRGELDFEASLVQRVALFAGLEAHRLEAILANVTFMPGAERLVATMRANGGWTALVSGGFTIFAERIAAQLGFHAVVANVLEIENGSLTGRVREPILGPQGKADTLKRLAAEGAITLSETLAVGDGANDLGMLTTSGLGVAFHAKPILSAQARSSENGAVVSHGDLTALLYLQGYTRDQFLLA